MNIKKIIAREFLVLMISIVCCGVFFLVTYFYNVYKDYKIDQISNDVRKQESKISDSKKFQNLYTLHQLLIQDEEYKDIIPPNFFKFKNVYSSTDRIKLLHEALRGDKLYYDSIPQGFENALIKYDIRNHFIYKGFISGKYLIHSEGDQNVDNLNEELKQLNSDKQKLILEKLSSDDKRHFNLISFLIIFILLFIVRYLIYALRWSMKILNS